MTHQHHISRKELKKDEIRETLVHGAEAALSHQRQLWMIGGAVLLVVLAIVGWKFYSQRQTLKASAAFDEALKVFHARIRGVNEPQDPGEVTYVDERNKYEDAAKKFGEVAGNYSRTRPGRVARYYAGLCYASLARYDDAQKWLAAAEGGDEELTALARFARAQVAERAGKGEEAVSLYKQLMDKPAAMVAKPLVMLTLADYYRKSNPAEAQKLYLQIRAEFPNSDAAQRAQERLDNLAPKT